MYKYYLTINYRYCGDRWHKTYKSNSREGILRAWNKYKPQGTDQLITKCYINGVNPYYYEEGRM